MIKQALTATLKEDFVKDVVNNVKDAVTDSLKGAHTLPDDQPVENKASGCSEAVRLPKDVMREVRTMTAIFESFRVLAAKV